MSSAEPRKIIKFGNSSHVISLPSSWVKENNLSKGDIVFIEKNGNNELIILPSKDDMSYSEKERKIIISVDGKDPETLRREITSAYINWQDIKIEIKPDQEYHRFLNRAVYIGSF